MNVIITKRSGIDLNTNRFLDEKYKLKIGRR
jgi:hypothetical protein